MIFPHPELFPILKRYVESNKQYFAYRFNAETAVFSRMQEFNELAEIVGNHFNNFPVPDSKPNLVIVTNCMSLPTDITRGVPFYYRLEDDQPTKPQIVIRGYVNADVENLLVYVPLKDIIVPGHGPAGPILIQHCNHRVV